MNRNFSAVTGVTLITTSRTELYCIFWIETLCHNSACPITSNSYDINMIVVFKHLLHAILVVLGKAMGNHTQQWFIESQGLQFTVFRKIKIKKKTHNVNDCV